MKKSLYTYISQVGLFKDLEKEEVSEIGKLAHLEKYSAGSYVFTEKDQGKLLYIVLKGRLGLSRGGKTITEFKPGDVFGEIALINKSIRTGSVVALEPCELICIKGDDLIEARGIPERLALKVLKELSRQVTSYLKSASQTRTSEVINEGESEFVEFKSTLRYNMFTKKFGKEIEHAALKTMAAFMNSRGGTLIIGVDDKKNILGLDSDNFENDDKTLLHVTHLVRERMGTQFNAFLNTAVEMAGGKKVLRIDVVPSTNPVFLTHNSEEFFFIRTGPSTTELKVSEIFDYIYHRFYRPGIPAGPDEG